MRLRVFASIFFMAAVYPVFSYAETIEFPEEELATESVLPVFDKKVVVRERAVTTEGRFEVGAGGGLNLVEPLYEQTVMNLTASYHLSELHGVNLSVYMLKTGLSKAGTDLKNGVGIVSPFDASLAPTVESMFFGNYQFSAYYGKINVSKQFTMNLSLYGLAGVGLANWSDKAEIAIDFGLGQRLYINSSWALRLDLMMAIYKGPDPTASNKVNHELVGDRLDSNQFESTVYFRPFLTLALAYLF